MSLPTRSTATSSSSSTIRSASRRTPPTTRPDQGDLPHRRQRRAQQQAGRARHPQGIRPAGGRLRPRDRPPGHDLRYAIESGKLRQELGWEPTYDDFEADLFATVQWYQANESWWRPFRGQTEAKYDRCGRGRDRLITTALLITGCNGQLNSEGIRQAHQLKDVPFTRGIDLTLDLTDPFTVRDTGGRRPDDPPQHRRRLPRRWDGPLRAG